MCKKSQTFRLKFYSQLLFFFFFQNTSLHKATGQNDKDTDLADTEIPLLCNPFKSHSSKSTKTSQICSETPLT